MNERIKLLAEKANAHETSFAYYRGEKKPENAVTLHSVDLELFAELIVQECVGLCDKAAEENARTFYTVTETQEVGPALVAKGSQVQAEKLSQQIKEHFGVEE